jgi:hypothetical protein
MENLILIHAEQIDSQAFGDPRLVSELCGGSFPHKRRVKSRVV